MRADRWGCTPSQMIRLAFGICLWIFITQTMADPDLWGHLRFGLDLLATHTIPLRDQYSFTADRLWINHEWLSELLMAIAYTPAGAFGLNLLKIGVIATIGAVMVAVARDERATPAARDVLLIVTLLVTYTRTQVIRPQMFSVAIFAVVLYLVTQIDRGRLKALWGIPVCFAVWVNLHGAWIVGLAVVGVWFAAAIIEGRGRRTTAMLVAGGVATLAATLVNPYGFGLWRFLHDTVQPVRADISDWKPLLALPPLIIGIDAFLPLVALLAAAKAGWRVPLRYVAMIAVLIVATVKIGRVDAFAGVAIAVLLAPQIIALLHSAASALKAPIWTASIPAAPVAIIAATAALSVGAWHMREIEVDGPWIPDPVAAVYLRAHCPGERVLTWFNWGEYALWQLAPAGIRVSIDGRRETVYSDGVLASHNAFYQAGAGELDYPDRIGADKVWLPVEAPAVASLRHRGWSVAFESARSVVLSRQPASAYAADAASRGPEHRIFPWP